MQAARFVEQEREGVAEREEVVGRACILSGEVRSAGALCDVISFLAHASWWGEMIVEHDDTLRALYFDEGHVIGAQSTVEGEGLELGESPREEIVGLVKRQIEAIFSRVVAIENGRFFFFEGFDERDVPFRHRLSVDGLLLDAIRKLDEKKYFESRIPSKEHVPVRTSAAPTTSDPFGIFDAIDGKRTVGEVAESIGLAEMEVTRALFQHVQAGDVAIKPPRLGAKQMVQIYNDAIVVLLRELDALGEGDGVRAQLRTFGEVGGERPYDDVRPEADGTIDVERTVAKVCAASEPNVAEDRLEQWLYDYASFALFLGRPHLERKEREKAPTVSDVPQPPRLPRLGSLGELPSFAAADTPGISTVRLRRVAAAGIPGVDPSRTMRMKSFDLARRAASNGTRRMHVKVVMPDDRPAPVAEANASRTNVAARAMVVESVPRRWNVVLLSAVVAIAFFVLGIVVATAGLGR